MKLIIDLTISCDEPGNKFTFGTVRRELDTNLVPVAGMEIEDSAWKNPREIKRVTMNPEEGYYYLWVGDDDGGTKERAFQRVQMYKSHGWQVLHCSEA